MSSSRSVSPHRRTRVASSLVAVIAATVIAAGCSSAQTPTPSVSPAAADGEWQPTTAWEKTLARVGPDGAVDLDTALVAFALAIAPLPGVTLPPGDPGVIDDGSEAIRWVRSHWDELTDAQRTEAQRHLIPPGRPGAVGGAVGGSRTALLAGLGGAELVPPLALPGPAAPADRPAQAVLDKTIEAIAAHLGRPLAIPVRLTVNTAEESVGGKAAVAYALVVDENGGAVGAPAECYVHMNPSGMALDDVAFTATLAHEAYHCFQGARSSRSVSSRSRRSSTPGSSRVRRSGSERRSRRSSAAAAAGSVRDGGGRTCWLPRSR